MNNNKNEQTSQESEKPALKKDLVDRNLFVGSFWRTKKNLLINFVLDPRV